jgi:hypothetical protein
MERRRVGGLGRRGRSAVGDVQLFQNFFCKTDHADRGCRRLFRMDIGESGRAGGRGGGRLQHVPLRHPDGARTNNNNNIIIIIIIINVIRMNPMHA